MQLDLQWGTTLIYDIFSSVTLAGALGAQWVLTLVLLKGDICPGQRGRLHKAFGFLVAAWGITIPSAPFSLLPFMALAIFAYRSKHGKTRQTGPIPVLHLANGLGAAAFVVVAFQQGVLHALLMLAQLLLVGAITAHCLLLNARSRLQAFHRILPVSGIVSAMLMAVTLAIASANIGGAMTEETITNILVALALVVMGVLVWAVHLFRQTPPRLTQLIISLLLIGSASGVATAAIM